jgi:hypothetical protein
MAMLLLAALVIFGLPRFVRHGYPYISQTLYLHPIDERHTVRIFTEYNDFSGVDVYAELLRNGRSECGRTDLFLHNKPLHELKFQTVVTGNSMVALVRPSKPFKILFLVDLQTMEGNRQGDRELWEDYRNREPRLLEKFRAGTKEPSYAF